MSGIEFCQKLKDDPKVFNTIANKEKLLCLLLENDFNQPVDQWLSYLHPAHKIPGLKGSFYSVIPGSKLDKIIERN